MPERCFPPRIADEYDKLAKRAENRRGGKPERGAGLKARLFSMHFLDLAQTWEYMAHQIEELEALRR